MACGYLSQVRRLPEEVQDTVIGAAIRQFAESYGGRKKIDDEVLSECIDLIVENFGQIGVMEIRTAYQLWSMRVINGAEMWGGEFNALQLGRVLSDYVRYRQKVVNEVINYRDDLAAKRKRELYAQARNQQVINAFPGELKEARIKHQDGDGFQSWRDIPGHWYKLAEKLGQISLESETKRPYWEKAQIEAALQIEAEIDRLFQSKRYQEAKNHKKDYARDTENFSRRASVIAQKMIAFDYLIKSTSK